MNIETLKSIQFPTIKSQHLVTGLAGVFALVSVQNIAHFFIELHHPFIASWTLGIAIGTALVILAHLLSEVDMRERKAFFGLLSVTLILVSLSGIIQGVTYAAELGAVGYILAFVLAATGEIVLPLAHSWHGEAKRRQAVNDAGQRVEEIAAETMIQVMSNTDTAKAQRQAEKRIEALIVAHVDATVTRLMPTKHNVPVTSLPEPTAKPPQTVGLSDNRLSPTELNKVKQNNVSQRRTEILSHVDGQDVKVFVASMTQLFNMSTKTIQRDIQALEDDGKVISNGVIVLTENLVAA